MAPPNPSIFALYSPIIGSTLVHHFRESKVALSPACILEMTKNYWNGHERKGSKETTWADRTNSN